jgi:hypothetical protein
MQLARELPRRSQRTTDIPLFAELVEWLLAGVTRVLTLDAEQGVWSDHPTWPRTLSWIAIQRPARGILPSS